MKGSAIERCVGSPGLFVRQRCLCGKGPERYALRDLLYLSLPHLDGLGLLREMRAHEQTRLIPVVAFSSADERQEAVTCSPKTDPDTMRAQRPQQGRRRRTLCEE